MTFIDAAKQILIENNNLPMSPKEIWSKISEKKLVSTSGKTPQASLSTIMLYSSKDSPCNEKDQYKIKYFEIIGNNPMKFRLLDYNTQISNPIQSTISTIIEEISIEKVLLYQITSSEINWKKISVYNNDENIEYIISDCDEYTYIMEDKAHATIKIGKTKNDPTLRLNQLKTGNPSISMIHVFPSSQFSESALHNRFSDSQKDLEWYFYTKVLRQFISDEVKRHESIIKSYNKRVELDKIEQEMINLF
jgi:hypothetical protein